MTPGVYSIVSALNGRLTQQERIAENISGATSVGHRRQVGAFGSFDKVLREAQGQTSEQKLVAPLSYAQAPAFDMTNGTLQSTGLPLDSAIVGEGFFAVQTASGQRLTRNGHFTVDTDNRLINDAGFVVLGRGGAITLPDGEVAIQNDGTITVNGRAEAQLEIFRPSDPTQLRHEGASTFSFEGTTIDPVTNPTLAPGKLELSNVELPREMVAMINNQRMYELLTRAFQTQDEGVGRAIQDLSSI